MGIRWRKPGAGRQTPQEALALSGYARSFYGERADNFPRTAYKRPAGESIRNTPRQTKRSNSGPE